MRATPTVIWLAATAAVTLGRSVVTAHTGNAGPVTPHDAWSAWHLDPLVAVLLAASGGLFANGLRQGFSGRAARPRQLWLFSAGWVALMLALVSPIDAMGEALFSAHMLQHEILMLIAAPLLVLAAADPILAAGVPAVARDPVRRIQRHRLVQTTWRRLTGTWTAWWIHALALWVWHVPLLFDATLRSDAVHTAQHLTFFGSAVVFWWALLRLPEGRRHDGMAVVALFTTALHASVLGALLTFGETVWYESYLTTTGAWGVAPIEDQRLGGLIMWVPAGVVYVAAALLLMLRLLTTPARQASAARVALGLTLLASVVMTSAGCRGPEGADHPAAVDDVERGRELMSAYGCGTCHEIPGVPNARARVGPPLWGMADRGFIGGVLPNTRADMIRWLRNPRAADPQTIMPDMDVTMDDARDMAAYLETLRAEHRVVRLARGLVEWVAEWPQAGDATPGGPEGSDD